MTAAEQLDPAMPVAGQSWRLTTTVTVADFGPVPAGMVAFNLADGRPFLFPLRAGLWRPADTPTAEVVLEQRIHQWERDASNAPRGSEEQAVARALVDELVWIRTAITRGTFQ